MIEDATTLVQYTLPCSTLITFPGKMPDMISIAEWGFGGGPALQSSKESMSDDIKL